MRMQKLIHSCCLSVAPAEGQKPMDIMTDKHFETMCNQDKLCLGPGTFSTEQPRKLTYKKNFNQCLLNVDGRFVKDLEYLSLAQYINKPEMMAITLCGGKSHLAGLLLVKSETKQH